MTPSYIQSVATFLLGIFLIGFPIVFSTTTTNPIILPKQILLGGVVFIVLLLLGLSMIVERTVKIRKTHFDLPVILFTIIVFISALFSLNRADSLIAFVPFFLSVLIYFLIINTARDKNSTLFFMSSLVLGAVILSIFSTLSFFKIYILPFPATHVQSFSPLGSMLDQAIYLVLVLTFAVYYTWREATEENIQKSTKVGLFGASSIIIVIGIAVSIYSLLTLEKPPILPFETGFQTAVAEIAFDSGRIAQGFLLGSGFGTYAVDFARWKPVSFNQNPSLWNLTFSRSSSFVLDLLATTGILGIASLLFLLIVVLKEIRKNIKNYMTFSLLAIFIIMFLLPINFVNQAMLFVILALYTLYSNKVSDIELQLVALKKGLLSTETRKSERSLTLPLIFMLVFLGVVGVLGFFSFKYVLSDLAFQKSLVAASQNNGSLTYQKQGEAIEAFPYRDGFYRSFSQTNLALANSLASSQQKDTPPPPDTQRQIITFIQQSINSARAATTLAPQTYLNWQNLSSIYRSLIGFGQNAESFAITTAQRSIALDPNNPQQYIVLGGIYYQLQQWENAQVQFQFAVNLKSDYANSHYNLGHVLEQKGDLQNALLTYQRVKNLVAANPNSLSQINGEIEALTAKIKTNQETVSETPSEDKALNINTPPAQLPKQTPQVKIPAPDIATSSSR